MGDPLAIQVGPGLLYAAPVGTAAPAYGTGDAESASWVPIGYTEEGNTVSSETSWEDILVAEELNPLDTLPTQRIDNISFQMAQFNAQNYSIAMNGGTIGVASGGTVTFEPPTLGNELFIALLWQAENLDAALLMKKCRQVGSVESAHQKAPNKALIAVEFRMLTPDDASAPWVAYFDASLDYADVHV